MKTALFIPIKLNNQRLPGKNLMNLNGRPLCDYIFKTALSLDSVDEKFVYCSDEAITQYIPQGIRFLKRDAYLDGGAVRGTEIIERFLRDVNADVYILTHVTQPFTKPQTIGNALGKVLNDGYDSAFSAVELQDYCWYRGKPLNYSPDNLVTTQNLEPVYMETGAFFIFRREVFETTGRRIGDKPYMHIVDQFERIDIDTAEDFALAEAAAAYLASKPEVKKQ
ncbi:MAG: acylneuraminate cytidylyltransferase family protein [Oscillospiraceae bacterium]|jgi:CMP-N-acetylneuraminic acid synthetase|nr:acylneuraminate cytidylyltransferase family protein [Oscillospiraceae bacterium]